MPSTRGVVRRRSSGAGSARRPLAGRSVSGRAHSVASTCSRAGGSRARCRVAISSSSAVRSSPPSTTARPPTSSVSHRARRRRARARRPGRRCRRGRGRRAATARRRRACRARASRARRRGRGSARRGRAERERLAGGQRRRAAAQRGRRAAPGAARPPARPPRWTPRRRRRGRPARRRRAAPATGAMPAPSRAFERRAVRDAGAGRAEAARPRASSRWTQCASQTSSPSQPSSLEVLDRAHAEPLAGRTPPRRPSRPGACAAARRGGGRARRTRAISSARDRERRARRERDPQHRAGRRVVEAVDRGLAGGEDRVAVLDDLVGRQAAVGAPEVHRAAARVEAQRRSRAPPRSRPRAGRPPPRGKT